MRPSPLRPKPYGQLNQTMAKQHSDTPKKKLGRPTKDPRIPINMRIPSKLLHQLRVEAAANDRSAASIVVELLRNRYKSDDAFK